MRTVPIYVTRSIPVTSYSGKVSSFQGRLFCRVVVDCVWNVMAHEQKRFCLSAKRTSPFKSWGALVQSTTDSRGVRISGSNGSNAGYTMFRGGVEDTGYPLHSPVSPSLPHPCVTVCHHISTGLYIANCHSEPKNESRKLGETRMRAQDHRAGLVRGFRFEMWVGHSFLHPGGGSYACCTSEIRGLPACCWLFTLLTFSLWEGV